MKVGDYVRTKTGVIAKCIEEKCDRYIFDKIIVEDGYYHNFEYKDVTPRGSYISKSSPNIIDLIEVGDYVNEHKIIDTDCYEYEKELFFDTNNVVDSFVNDDIKSIVTKEQFESMKYKVGE